MTHRGLPAAPRPVVESLEKRSLLSGTVVSGDALVDEKMASVGADGQGNFVVAWEGADASGRGVFAQRFDAAGQKVGGAIAVSSTTANDQLQPQVAVRPDGEFVIAWTGVVSDGRKGTSREVFVRRFDANGVPAGGAPEARVNTTTVGNQLWPDVAYGADGGFVVAWDGQPGSTSKPSDVFLQRFGRDGLAVGRETRVNTYTGDNQVRPSVGMHPTLAGSFAVAWESAGQDGSLWGVYAQRFEGHAPKGSEFRLSEETYKSQTGVDVDMGPDGSVFAAWWSNAADTGGDVRARRFAADGTAAAEFTVSGGAGGQTGPSVDTGIDGRTVVGYYDGPTDALGDLDAFLKVYEPGATDAVETIVSGEPGGELYGGVAWRPDGSVACTWTGFGEDGDEDVYASTVDAVLG